MNGIVWSEWRTKSKPNVGDYVQVEYWGHPGEVRLIEGFVCSVDGLDFFLSGLDEDGLIHYVVRWRVGRLPEWPAEQHRAAKGNTTKRGSTANA